MATKEENEKLMEILKFTPRTYKIVIWGYGGETVIGSIDEKVWDFFRNNRINLSDFCWDDEYGNEVVPEEFQPFTPSSWYDCDGIYHHCGGWKNSCRLQVLDENDNVVYEIETDNIDGCDGPQLEIDEEIWLAMNGKNSYIFHGHSAEKGTFFEGSFELTTPFDPAKITLVFDEVNDDDLISKVKYNDEDIENNGGDTTGKGSDFYFYKVEENGDLTGYQDGNDVDEDFDDGTPPMGPSPSEWEKSPKIKKGNPSITGWYSACWSSYGTSYGTLYWNNEEQKWQDFHNGRITGTWDKVNYWQGYNWDTSDWANRPVEPPDMICKKCSWTGMRSKMREDDDYNDHCPDCDTTEVDWIEYDPDTAKGRKNRKQHITGKAT